MYDVNILDQLVVCSYLLMAIVRKRRYLRLNLYTMLQILSASRFEKNIEDQAFLLRDALATEKR